VVSTRDEIPLERSLPGPSFTSDAEFAREREAVLFAGWFCVGREENLTGPGDYLTADVAGESVVVVRGADGTLAGFYNLCRHRGSRLVPVARSQPAAGLGRSGCAGTAIRCPYHGWTYGLDGSLRAAPFLPELRRYRARLALHPVGVTTWGGFVFARLGSDGPPLADQLNGADRRLATYPLAELRTAHRLVYGVAANWKVICENYNECYHCGPVHPELCELIPAFRRGGGSGLDWDGGIPHRDGAYTFTHTGTTRRAPFPGLSAADLTHHRGELVLPNLMLSVSADHVAAFTLWPHDAGHTTVLCDFLFYPGEIARGDFDPSDAVEFWDLVNRQDWSICEQVQDGMGSRMFTAGYLAPMEQPSADVGRYVTRRLAARPPAVSPARATIRPTARR
jgi:Rieske 2Fe-2S family protein